MAPCTNTGGVSKPVLLPRCSACSASALQPPPGPPGVGAGCRSVPGEVREEGCTTEYCLLTTDYCILITLDSTRLSPSRHAARGSRVSAPLALKHKGRVSMRSAQLHCMVHHPPKLPSHAMPARTSTVRANVVSRVRRITSVCKVQSHRCITSVHHITEGVTVGITVGVRRIITSVHHAVDEIREPPCLPRSAQATQRRECRGRQGVDSTRDETGVRRDETAPAAGSRGEIGRVGPHRPCGAPRK